MKKAKLKMTEIGPIPEDWEVKRLGEVLTIGNGKDYKHLTSGTIPVYGTGGLMTYVNDWLYDGVTVCIGRKGTIDVPQYHEGKIWTVDTLYYTYDFKDVDIKFLYYLFLRIDWLSYNSATGVPSLTAKAICDIEVVLPPLAEQKAIAEALSDVDELLAAMTTLIEKKRAIKQGAMQELLTGKKRLVGFKNSESSCLCASVLKKDAGVEGGGFNTETQRRRGTEFKMTEIGPIPKDWEVKRVGDIGQVITGSTPPRNNSANWGGDFNWISAKDFNGKYISKTEEHITEAGKRFCRLLPENSVLVTCIASIGLNAIAKKACATNQQINAVVCRVDLPEYLYYQICYRSGDLKILAGQTAVPIIGKKQFEDVLIPVPTLAEQEAIAEVLSDMDAEIEALEAKRAKYESIKQSMMQELLTGRMRMKD